MKKNFLAAAAFLLALGVAAVSQTAPQTTAQTAPQTTAPTAQQPKYHVVFQLTEPQGPAWDMLVAHVTNMRKALAKDGVEVEVVFFGPGLNMILKKNTDYEDRLKKLAGDGVTLAACQNAMRLMNVKTEDLFPFTTQVDSGVAELVRRQQQGWQYIH